MDGPFYMDAVITPSRSLSRRGLIVLICVLTALNAATAAIFLVIGAKPVPVFLAIDLVAVVAALAVGRRVAAVERVQVTAREVRVLRQTRAGAHTVWISPTAFTRLDVLGEAEGEADLRLRLATRELALARSLSRRERLDFGQALVGAIARARTGMVV